MANFIPVEPEKWAEMVKALAAVERLKAEVERLTAQVSYDNRTQLHVDKLAAEFTQYEVEKLRAEVARLRKAGDAMEADLRFIVFPGAGRFQCLKDWNAAKEGKQS